MGHKPYDAGLKDVVEERPVDWAAFMGASSIRRVRLIDADVSTVTAAADKAMMIDSGGPEWILHPEFVSGRDLDLPHKTWWYNSVFHHRHRCLVRSVVLLLRPVADGPGLTGSYAVGFPEENAPYNIFRFRVIRLWQLPVERLLTGGVGILPLAPLADDAARILPEVVRRIEHRLKNEVSATEADKLRATTTILMGLRHPAELIQHLMQGATAMLEKVYLDSSVVQAWGDQRERSGEEHGAVTQARKQLLRLGQIKLGPPDASTSSAIAAIDDLGRLDALSERLLGVTTWADLLKQDPD